MWIQNRCYSRLTRTRFPSQIGAETCHYTRHLGGTRQLPRGPCHTWAPDGGFPQPRVGNAARCWRNRASFSPSPLPAAHTPPSPAHTGGPGAGPPHAARPLAVAAPRTPVARRLPPPRPLAESALRTQQTAFSTFWGEPPLRLGRPIKRQLPSTANRMENQEFCPRSLGQHGLAQVPRPRPRALPALTQRGEVPGEQADQGLAAGDSVSCPHPNWSTAGITLTPKFPCCGGTSSAPRKGWQPGPQPGAATVSADCSAVLLRTPGPCPGLQRSPSSPENSRRRRQRVSEREGSKAMATVVSQAAGTPGPRRCGPRPLQEPHRETMLKPCVSTGPAGARSRVPSARRWPRVAHTRDVGNRKQRKRDAGT